MSMTRTWIMDGHNMIFAIPPLQALQVSDRREEARRGLVDRLRPFALARCQRVLVVFDGNDLHSNPDSIREPLFEVVYARRSEGEADDRIIHEARLRSAAGHHVTVVTNDVSTLAGKLPKEVDHLRVEVFWLKHLRKAVGDDSKRVVGDFSDMEREMEALAAKEEQAARDDHPGLSYRAGVSPAGSSPTHAGTPVTLSSSSEGYSAEKSAISERIRRKRDLGRLRQERRLKRRLGPGRHRRS